MSSIQVGIFIFPHFLGFSHISIDRNLCFFGWIPNFNYFPKQNSSTFQYIFIDRKFVKNTPKVKYTIPSAEIYRYYTVNFLKNDLICQKKSFQNKKNPNKRKMCNVYQCKSSVSCDKIASPKYPKSVYTMKFKNSLGEH